MRRSQQAIVKWLSPGLRIKRWLIVLMFGISVLAVGFAQVIVAVYRQNDLPIHVYIITLRFLPLWGRLVLAGGLGFGAIGFALYELNLSILAPFSTHRQGKSLIDAVYAHSRRQRGLKVVAIGGGTGLPSVLRGLKAHTSNITAIVTVADDGGSSGRLRKELGVLPPGDLRSNIAALANDEDLMTQLFQYRFATGGLEGHSFGNLFLTALSDITGSMDRAVVETGRVLAIEGRVLPSTLHNVTLMAEVNVPGEQRLWHVSGESRIPEVGGKIERVFLDPSPVRAYPEAVQAILSADLLVIGPGSLFTSILPNLLVTGITEAIRASSALRVYVCNVATQVGETDGFDVAAHVSALESHIGTGVFDAILANNSYPSKNAGETTSYVLPTPEDHAIYQNYAVHMVDLTDAERPWRHDPFKLTQALLRLVDAATQSVSAPLDATLLWQIHGSQKSIG